jgi:uncharacterized protein (DUF2147 family)
MHRVILGLSAFLFLSLSLSAQSPIGIWKTIDDETGEAKSKVQIYESNGKLYGKVIDLLIKPDDTLCTECDGAKKNKPVVGMVILEDLAPYNDYWKNGTILDPNNGSTYRCSIWFEDGKSDELQVRGKHWTGLYRTQTWFRTK